MNKTFNLLFFLKKNKMKPNGTVPIYLRITIDGTPKEISTKRYILPEKWENKMQKVSGNSIEAKEINSYLKTLELEVYATHHQMIKEKKSATSQNIKARILGTDKNARMLIPIFQEHNNRMESLVKREEYAGGTLDRYKTSLKHTQDFLKWKYKSSDIDICEIDNAFVNDYYFYLRTERDCANNTSVKYLKNFKKIIQICIDNGWLDKDPFISTKFSLDNVNPFYLSEDELETIRTKNLRIERLTLVRDLFIFSCYTGLAYADVRNLTSNNISFGIDGEKWIFTKRQKTKVPSHIPLLPIAENILTKYQDHPKCLNDNRLLPMLSNQRMNSYLKEIGDLCGIAEEITFHTARHTFATSVTLTNGVSIESVSKMLGHTNIKTTQHYAKILDKKVSQDMQQLKKIFALKPSNNKDDDFQAISS